MVSNTGAKIERKSESSGASSPDGQRPKQDARDLNNCVVALSEIMSKV